MPNPGTVSIDGQDGYQIHLNFLPVENNATACLVYRRFIVSSQEERPVPEATAHKLPKDDAREEGWQSYWVLLQPAEGFEAFEYNFSWNADLSRRILFECLKHSVEASLQPRQYQFPTNSFIQEVSLIMATHPEGDEVLVVQPYFMKASRQNGFLVDFHFKLRSGTPFGRRIQQLSLSLDKNFRRNVDYYVDRSSKVRRFLETRWPLFEGMTWPGTSEPLRISKDFVALPAERLRPKIYVFAGSKESRSQFTGLREFGPLQPLENPPRLLFAFREQDRQAARRLALSLRGQKQRGQYNFPGFNELSKTPLEIDANPIVLPDLSSASMEVALQRAKNARMSSPRILPVIVLPNGDDNGYLAQKAHFSHAGMPTQVCTLRILEDEESLKWAIANLALQIFCKAGGRPWKVRPTAERSLIIGISQSHKSRIVDDQVHIDKYFAFSVLTDSSGLFQQIQVLGDSTDHSTYVEALRANLKRVLEQNAGAFNRVVIHTSFKLKHEEIRAIQQTTRDVASVTDRSKCRFSVIKINHKSRFFGINRSVNSLVPYEATKVRLGPHEYLIWFEGIYLDKPNVTKATPKTSLEIIQVELG
jgi:Piwi domain